MQAAKKRTGHRCWRLLLQTNVTVRGIVYDRKHIISWFDLETFSKVIENGKIRQNTHGFLLEFYMLAAIVTSK